MKRAIHLLVFLAVASVGWSQTHWRHLRPVANNMFVVSALGYCTPDEVVAVGYDPDYCGLVLRSTDRGITWVEVFRSVRDSGMYAREEKPLLFYDVSHPSPQRIYAVADSLHFDSQRRRIERGNVLVSTDAGRTWRFHIFPEGVSAWSMSTCDTANVLVYAHGGAGRRYFTLTSDGGVSWRDVALPDSVASITDFQMLAPADWVAIGVRTGTETRYLYTTKDAGETWSRSARSLGEHWARKLFFLDAERGWVYGERKYTSDDMGRPFVSRTTDGGVTWVVQLQDRVNGYPGGLFSLAFVDSARGRAVGRFAQSLVTSDAGASWRLEETGVTRNSAQNFICTASPSADVALIGTNMGYILTYTDKEISDPPFIVTPVDRDTNVARPVAISWTEVPGAVYYDVQFSLGDVGFTQTGPEQYGITGTSTVVDGFRPGEVYAARVRAHLADDSTNWSGLRGQCAFRTAYDVGWVATEAECEARIRPNPTELDRAILDLPLHARTDGVWEVVLSDVLGRTHALRGGVIASSAGTLTIDLTRVPNGIYQVHARSGAELVRSRLVVSK